jgi:hypothetical protein
LGDFINSKFLTKIVDEEFWYKFLDFINETNRFIGREEDFNLLMISKNRIKEEYPLILGRIGGECYVLRAGKKQDKVEIIELLFDSGNEFVEFWKDYKTSGFDFNSDEVVSLKRVLPPIPISIYNVLKDMPIDDILIKINEYITK